MSTVHQFPVQRNQPPAAPEEVADALAWPSMRRSERTPASRRVTRRPWHSRMRPRDSSWSANCWRSRTVTAPTWKLTVSSTSGTSRGSCGISRCAGRSTSSGGPTAKWGVRNGPTLVPLALDAGLVERTTPALGFRIALGYAKDHMRSCAEDMTADHRCPPSRSTLERVAKANRDRGHAGGASHRTAPAAGGAGAGRRRRHLTGPRPHVGAMEDESPAGETPATRRKTRHTPYTRHEASPGECQLPMAYVGTISFHDADGTALATRRSTAAAHESPTDRLVRPMMADLRHALRQVPALAVGVIQDGAPRAVESPAPGPPGRTAGHGLLRSDRPVSSHRAGSPTSYGTGSPTRPLAGRGCLGGTRASTALTTPSIASAHGSVTATPTASPGANRRLLEQLAPHLTYLENNADLMHDARLRAVGLPVGRGVTEGACKSVIKMRTNGSSQRWRPTGLEGRVDLTVHAHE